MLGAASVISTGSALRGRGNCGLETTPPTPPSARGGGSPSLPVHHHRATAASAAPSPLRAACLLLRGLLLLLLEPVHVGQRLRAVDIGDGAMRSLLAVRARRLTPPRRRDAVLLAEEGEEDLRLLGSETG